MAYGWRDLPGSMSNMTHLIRAKTLDLVNAEKETEGSEKEALFTRSRTEAEKWYETASEEEREELLKRFPEDVDQVD